jgi:biopolymer transport protein ExbD
VKTRRRNLDEVSFQLAPMIDMTFLLLVFFMVTTKISREQLKLEVDLPVASNAVTPDDLAGRDIVSLDAAGQVYIGNDLADKKRLATYLKQRFKDYPPLRLYIRCDRATHSKQVKEVMRTAAEAGAIDVIFGTYQDD